MPKTLLMDDIFHFFIHLYINNIDTEWGQPLTYPYYNIDLLQFIIRFEICYTILLTHKTMLNT